MVCTLEYIRAHRLVVIYRGIPPADCLEISRVLMDAGVRLFEVTMDTPEAVEAIEQLHTELNRKAEIGAGTVTEIEQVDMAIKAGASYIISPNTDVSVIRRTKELGLISIPGAFSPTEILAAYKMGADMIKVFPINAVGPRYIAQLRGPIAQIPFMVTGGVKLEVVQDLFRAGSDAIGIDVRLLGAELVESKNWTALYSEVRKWLAATRVVS